MESPIKIGTLLLDIQTNQLISDGNSQQIEPKLVEVLYFLYQHRNQVVTRQQLIDVVWKGQVVSDNAINRSISQVRKLISQSKTPCPTIETIPRVGYRLQLEYQVDSNVNESDNKIDTEAVKKCRTTAPFIKLPDKNSLKVILFLAFSLAIFARYFYQQINQSENVGHFSQASLTLSPGLEKLPKIAPSGEWLAYAETNPITGNEHLFAISLNSEQKVKLTDEPLYLIDLAWSPDSKSIIYSSWKSTHDRRCSVRLLKLDFTKNSHGFKPESNTELFECSERAAIRLAWNDLGNKIFLTNRPSYDRPYFVQSYSLESKRTEQVTLPPQSGNLRGDYYISGSLSGKYLAIVRYLGTNQGQLKIYNTRNKEFIATQMLNSVISALTWSTDEQLLILKNNNLYLYDYNNNQEKFFYAIGKNSGGLTADKKLELIAFTVSERDINLARYQRSESDISTEPLELIGESSAIEAVPSYSNDQNQIAFLSNRSGSYQIWLANGQGTVKQLSDSPASLTLSPLSWSPDDKQILFQYDEEIFSIEVENGKINRVIDRQHLVANADWSFDGTSIFYSSEKSGEWQIWQFDQINQSHRQVTEFGGYSAKQDKNNNLYVSRIHQDGLWKLDYDPASNHFSKAKLLLSDFSGTNWLSWQLNENNIYYFGSVIDTVSNEKQFGIMQLELSNQTSKLWFPFDRSHQRYFSVSSNDLIVTKVTRNEGSIELLTKE